MPLSAHAKMAAPTIQGSQRISDEPPFAATAVAAAAPEPTPEETVEPTDAALLPSAAAAAAPALVTGPAAWLMVEPPKPKSPATDGKPIAPARRGSILLERCGPWLLSKSIKPDGFKLF